MPTLALALQEGLPESTRSPLTLTLFVAYLAGMVGIGLWAAARSGNTQEDYFLGGRRMSTFVTALSAVSSGRSAWLVVGVSAATWKVGLSAVWMFPGYILVEFVMLFTLGRRLRDESARAGAITVPEVLQRLARGPDGSRGSSRLPVRAVGALIVVLFLTTYVSGQLAAGGKALEALFAVDGTRTGLAITGGIVLAYTVLGGYRAVAVTDVIQALFMLAGLVVLPLVGLAHVGGVEGLVERLRAVDPELLRWVTAPAAVVAGLGIGLGSLGNPPILVRAMSIREPTALRRAAWIGLAWNVVMAAGAFGIGLVGRALYPAAEAFPGADPDQLYPLLGATLSEQYLFAGFVGILLAALFAAIMSTCDSQLLVIASSLLRDFRGERAETRDARGLTGSRLTVLLTVLVAVAISFGNDVVINRFILWSWGALGAAFGPPLCFALYDRRTSARGVLAGMLAGAGTVVAWASIEVLDAWIYELVPGFVVSALVTVALRGRRSGNYLP